jgi:hypothetical protein
MKRLHRTFDSMQIFMEQEWFFTNDNFISLSETQTKRDRKKFVCDVRGIDWGETASLTYFQMRKVFLREKDEDVEKAKIRMK